MDVFDEVVKACEIYDVYGLNDGDEYVHELSNNPNNIASRLLTHRANRT